MPRAIRRRALRQSVGDGAIRHPRRAREVRSARRAVSGDTGGTDSHRARVAARRLWFPGLSPAIDRITTMNIDEPLFDEHDDTEPKRGSRLAVRERVRRLVNAQPYAVLCMQGQGQPYGALVAFAFSSDLRTAVFATPIATRKYRLLSECAQVALVIDNRPGKREELMEIEAVTATGRASLMGPGSSFDQWSSLLVSRHAYLRAFVRASSCALFRIDIVRYLHVVRFQEVSQWIPDARC